MQRKPQASGYFAGMTSNNSPMLESPNSPRQYLPASHPECVTQASEFLSTSRWSCAHRLNSENTHRGDVTSKPRHPLHLEKPLLIPSLSTSGYKLWQGNIEWCWGNPAAPRDLAPRLKHQRGHPRSNPWPDLEEQTVGAGAQRKAKRQNDSELNH